MEVFNRIFPYLFAAIMFMAVYPVYSSISPHKYEEDLSPKMKELFGHYIMVESGLCRLDAVIVIRIEETGPTSWVWFEDKAVKYRAALDRNSMATIDAVKLDNCD